MSTDNGLTRRDGGRATEGLEGRRLVAPPVDIYENADEILVVADVPGARPDGITVRLDKEELFLHARCDDETHGKALAGGPRSANYSRTFLVPQGVDAEKISAELTAGVLRIRLPKSEALKPRKIAVRAS